MKKLVSGIMLMLLLGNIFFSFIALIKGETEIHDLWVFLNAPIIWNTYNHLENGTSTVLNMTVVNKGDFNENTVNLQLLINGSIAQNSTASNLSPNETFWTAYLWAPEDGVYNLTAYAPPVNGEIPPYDTNNTVTKWVNVSINQAPYADFTYSPLSLPPNPRPLVNETITFNASDSYDPDWGTILNYTWDFGDNKNGSGKDITHAYNTYGEYNVTLTLIDTENETSNRTKSIKVYAPPIAHFNCTGYMFVDCLLTFDASASKDPDNNTGPPTYGIVNYTWNFGDGKFNTTSDPIINHTYASPDTYYVILTVSDSDNLTDFYLESIPIDPGYPNASFTIIQAPPYFVNQNVTFDASSSFDPDGGDISSYFWNWSDGTNSTTMTPVINHNFTQPKIYNVTLTVTDDESLTDSINKSVPVILQVLLEVKPEVINASTGDKTLSINITIANVEDLKFFLFKIVWPPHWLPPSSDWPELLGEPIEVKKGDFLGEEWCPEGRRFNFRYTPDAGEGFILINCTFFDIVPVENRSGSGTLATIILSVKSSGNSSLSLADVQLFNSTGSIIHEPNHGYFYTHQPVANFTWSKALPNQNVTFDASSSYDPDDLTPGSIANYTWNFDDGTPPKTTSDPIINYTFSERRTYYVNLTVTDDEGEKWSNGYQVFVGTRNVTITIEPSEYAFNETSGEYENNGELPITVTIINNGSFAETFNVTVYANNETLGTLPVTVGPSDSQNLTFKLHAYLWHLGDGFLNGSYIISANATLDDEELDHETVEEMVIVGLAGDVNDDGWVELGDNFVASQASGSYPGHPDWNPDADLNSDGCVELTDFFIIGQHAGNRLE